MRRWLYMMPGALAVCALPVLAHDHPELPEELFGIFEREDPAFFERIRASYLQRADAEPGRIRRIDASAPEEAVRAQVLDAVGTLV